MTSITQYPTPPNEWLHNGAEDYTRIFTDYVIRNAESPAWQECTNAEKIAWEEAHPQPEPEITE